MLFRSGYTRKHLMIVLDECVDSSLKRQKDRDSGQVSMFEMFAEEDHGFGDSTPPPNGDEWDKKMKLAFEKEMLGIFVSDHPLREMAEEVRRAADYSLGELDDVGSGAYGWFAGILTAVIPKPTKNGKMMAVIQLEDLAGSIEGVLFPAVYDKHRELVVEDAILRLRAKFEEDDRGDRKSVV